MATNEYQYKVFNGGITDHYVDSPMNQHQVMANFVNTFNKKPKVREGSEIYDSDKPQIPAGAQRIGTIFNFNNDLLVHSAKKVYYENGSSWATLQGPVTSNEVFTTGTTTDYVSHTQWNNHLYVTNDAFTPLMKIYKDNSSTLQVRNMGLPQLASDPTLTPTAGANSYVYKFLHRFDYNVGTVQFKDYGPTRSVSVGSAADPSAGTLAISAIPVLANGSTNNYDTATIKIEIYRTTNGGTAFFYVGEVTNGTTTYNDTTSDASLVSNAALYTEGGILENDPPPLCKYIHTADNGFTYFGNVKIGTELITNRIYQSKDSDPDSVPSTNFLDLDDEIMGISSYYDRVIVPCKSSVYRIDNFFDEQGNGGMERQRIDATLGCVSGQSIVQIPEGIVWASEEGFAFSDGFKAFIISRSIPDRYKVLVQTQNQKDRIQGVYDKHNKLVYWSIQSDSAGGSDVNMHYILDLRWGINEYSCFTTAENSTYYAPTGCTFLEKNLIRGDSRGYVFKHDPSLLNDPRIDTSVSASTWDTAHIPYDLTTHASSFGTTKLRKFIPKMLLAGKNVSNLSLQVSAITDLGTKIRLLKPIRFRGNLVWGDHNFEWGDPSFIWGAAGTIEEQRRMHGDDLRCSYKQLRLTPAEVILANSDQIDTGTVNALAKTITLDDTVTYDWPTNLLTKKIYFEDDNYATGFEITARTADTITVTDPSLLLTDGSKKWIIKGFATDEVLDLLDLTLIYEVMGETQTDYDASSVGGNE